MIEQWKDLTEPDIAEGCYLISNTGKVKSLKTNSNKTMHLINSGYLTVNLISSNHHKFKTKLIHRLVAKYFCTNDNPLVKTTVDHIDGNKLNNWSINLEWVSQGENNRRAKINGLNKNFGVNSYRSKLTIEQVHTICKLLEENIPYSVILQKIGFDTNNSNNYDLIGNIYRGITYKDISSQYHFHDKQLSTIFTNDQIHIICKLIKSGTPIPEIYNIIFGNKYSFKTCKWFYEVCRRIKRGELYRSISLLYNI